MRRVSVGQPLRIAARDWNQIAELVDSQVQNMENPSSQSGKSFTAVEVINNTGSGIDEGRLVQLGSPTLLPSNDVEQFKQSPVYSIQTADASSNLVFAVLLQPLNNGEIGLACISGHCAIYVDTVTATSDTFANPDGNGGCVSASEGVVKLAYLNPSGGWSTAILGAGGGGGEGGISSGQYTGPFAINVLGDLPQSSIRVSAGTVHTGASRISVPTTSFAATSTGTYYVKLTVTWEGTTYNSYTYSLSLVGSSTETFSYTSWEKVLGVVQASNVTDETTGETAVKWTAFSQWWMGGSIEVPGRCL